MDELKLPKGFADALGFGALKRPAAVSDDVEVGLLPKRLLAVAGGGAGGFPNRPPTGAEVVGVPIDCEVLGFVAPAAPRMLKDCCGLLVPNNVDVEFPVLLAGGGPAGVVDGLPSEKPPILFEAGVVVPALGVAVPVDPILPQSPPDELPPGFIVLLAAPPNSV